MRLIVSFAALFASVILLQLSSGGVGPLDVLSSAALGVTSGQICLLAKSLFDRGLTQGNTGNISARTGDGRLLIVPTGTSFGRLGPARLSRFDAGDTLISGDPPTKKMLLHTAFCDTRSSAGAVVYQHACRAVTRSMRRDADTNADTLLPAVTPYAMMQLVRAKPLAFFLPGDPAMGKALRGLTDAQGHSVVTTCDMGWDI